MLPVTFCCFLQPTNNTSQVVTFLDALYSIQEKLFSNSAGSGDPRGWSTNCLSFHLVCFLQVLQFQNLTKTVYWMLNFGCSASIFFIYFILHCLSANVAHHKHIFFFSFQPFPSVRGGHSISSFSTSFCLQHLSPSHQLPAYLPLLHLKIFSLVSLFSSFPVTPFPSFFFLHTLGLSS